MWRVALASAIGTSHHASGVNCQDSAGYRILQGAEGKILVAAISDGAGSARFSDVGSAKTIATVIDEIGAYVSTSEEPIVGLTRSTASAWLTAIRQALASEAATSGAHIQDYACTLLVAIVGPTSAAFLQIGDGAIVVSHGQEDGFAYVFWPQHGQYANTTNFVTADDAEIEMQFEVAPRRISELAIFSDGLENLLLDYGSKSVHARFFEKILSPLRIGNGQWNEAEASDNLSRFLMLPMICDRTDDDKSLVLAVNRRE